MTIEADIANAVAEAVAEAIDWPEEASLLDTIEEAIAHAMPSRHDVLATITIAITRAMPTATELATAIAAKRESATTRRRAG